METWDIYDSQGNPTGAVKPRGDALCHDEYHLAASLWIINHTGELLIQRRALIKRIHPGKWSITGGAALAGESSAQACVREVSEELGIKLNEQDITLLYRYFGKDTIFDDYAAILDIALTDAVLQAEEVSEIAWASAREIRELFDRGEFMFDDIKEMDKVINYMRQMGIQPEQ